MILTIFTNLINSDLEPSDPRHVETVLLQSADDVSPDKQTNDTEGISCDIGITGFVEGWDNGRDDLCLLLMQECELWEDWIFETGESIDDHS
ncbi:hypothetical protein WICPIJ_004297 [Wickerhamomyces pijperi]|uniref:Uncharacterized protein n=1 Tax=Wickerhamomyces pijperi TaxID=599730 RepID=A0A9P8TNE3_WICPI|nr:hypothetical protein WICPIJ_004297 [Wickerhamomyces pijperi]